jgi:hypothetical protein
MGTPSYGVHGFNSGRLIAVQTIILIYAYTCIIAVQNSSIIGLSTMLRSETATYTHCNIGTNVRGLASYEGSRC